MTDSTTGLLDFVQNVLEHAFTTGLIWTGGIVLVTTLTVIGLAFSPGARASRVEREPAGQLFAPRLRGPAGADETPPSEVSLT